MTSKISRRRARAASTGMLACLVLVVMTGIGCVAGQADPPAETHLAAQNTRAAEDDGPMNVLFIAVDDLRPALGAYSDEHAITPHMDRLSERSVTFERAYANVPVCGASRASLLTGLRPTRERFVTYFTRADEDAPDVPTLPEYLKEHGYHTAGLGKIFHSGEDSPDAWSVPHWHPNQLPTASSTWRNYLKPENDSLDALQGGQPRGPMYERIAVPDSAYYDGQIAREAARRLDQLAEREEPFFLGVGFLKPHLPFNAPERYWQLHPYSEIELPGHGALPKDAPGEAWDVHGWGELRTYRGAPQAGPVADTLARRLIQGYRAATSYVDAQIGHVLQALEEQGLADETIVVLWGDHGFSLGEHGLWSKHSTFDVAMRVPLLIRVPGQPPGRVDTLTELLDLYPTLVDLTGLPQPDHLQGTSLVPLLRQEDLGSGDPVYARYMDAEAVRTDRYLYTTWFDEADSAYAHMLYDHQVDPLETRSLAPLPGHETIVDQHRALLEDHRAGYGQ